MSLLHEARQELWQELQGLNEEQLNQKLSDDTWSIQEVTDHLKKMDLMAAKHLAAEGKKHRSRNMSQSRWKWQRTVLEKPLHLVLLSLNASM